MKKLIINTIIFAFILSSVVFVMPQFSFAAEQPSGSAVSTGASNLGTNLIAQLFSFTNLPDLINSLAGTLANWAMAGAGFLLSISAYLLDVSINLTLNIKAFVEATPVVYSVWRILRDITGLFFIFYLLYAAIQMMTGFGKGASYASTIKNIVIAGILINFSFFIVSVSIDFSNVISQAIYNAIIPEEVVMRIDPNTNLSTLVGNAGKSNISNIFMNSLRIQQIYDTNGNRLGVNIADPVKTSLIGLAGVIMMVTTAASFTLAALAFIARLIILIFLLAFSSLWFVSWVIPEVNKHSSKVVSQLYNQLIFMPAYLLLMYVGLTIINGSKLLQAGSINTLTTTGTNWIMPYVLILVNFAIVIIILNLPLTVALSMGGFASGWLKKSIDKWDAQAVWKNIGGWAKNKAPGIAWNNTGGRISSKLAQSEGLKNIASRNVLGELTLKGVRGAASNYDKKLADQVKSRMDFANSLGYDERAVLNRKLDLKQLKNNERVARSRGNATEADRLKTQIKETEAEIESTKKERQTNYSDRIASRSPETLFMKVARKDKVAAAKINIELWQKQLDKKKETLAALKTSLGQIERDIRNDQARTGSATPNPILSNKKTDIESKIAEQISNPTHNFEVEKMGVEDLQSYIDYAKLHK